jgi:hypothetical protein
MVGEESDVSKNRFRALDFDDRRACGVPRGDEGGIGSNFPSAAVRKTRLARADISCFIAPVSLRRVRQVCPKEYEHIRVELAVEGNAVEAVRIDAYQRNVLRQRGRTGRQEREVPGVWNDAIFMF